MIKRSLLASSITLAMMQTATAAPLAPIDARGMGMGGTGVASAKLAHAPQYNPALLSTAHEDDDFAIVLPQLGVVVADENEVVDGFDSLVNDEYTQSNGQSRTIIEHFEDISDELNSILSTGPNPIDTQLNNFQTLLDNVPGAGGNDSTTSAQLVNATNQLTTSTGALTGQTQELEDTTLDLTSDLNSLSGKALRGTLGVNGAVAIPSKKFAAAISVGGSAYFSGRMFFTNNDTSLLNGYAEGINAYANAVNDYTQASSTLASATAALESCSGPADCTAKANAVSIAADAADAELTELQDFSYEKDGKTILDTDPGTGEITLDDDLNSNVQIIAVAITELGLTFSRNFDIKGHDIAIGITPKLQQIKTFSYVASVNDEEIDEDAITDTEQDFSDFNIDAGVAYQFGDSKQWQAGVVAKNLLSNEYEAVSNTNATLGEAVKTTISLDTQFRAGVSHTTDWTVVAVDLDLMENDPVAFEAPTQYASIGAEFDLFDTLQLRAGYRNNLSESDASVVSVGLGVSPFGVHFDLAAMANPSDPKKEAGVAMEFGFYF